MGHRESGIDMRQAIIAEIEGWLQSGLYNTDNWDGQGGSAINESSIQDIKTFLQKLEGRIRYPETNLLVSGNISLLYREVGSYADLEFPGTGIVKYFIKTDGETHKDQFNLHEEDMPEIVNRVVIWKLDVDKEN